MSKQPIIDPLNIKESKTILKNWMEFYTSNQEKLQKHLMKKYPKKENEDENVYTKAIKARCFDSMRGFLPAGITTQLSWHTNLRQAADKLSWLRHNPLPEVKEIADTILFKLKEKYPQSFSHPEIDDQENYRETCSKKYNFYNPQQTEKDFSYKTNISQEELEKYNDIINTRPIKTGLPHFLSELGNITFEFLIDFGSFRDIQRHRNGVCRMPLLTTKLGFNEWYMEQLPEDLRLEAKDLIKKQIEAIEQLNISSEIKQYYIALGFNVACKNSYGLPAAIYVTELRSGKMVHPTLRKTAHKMHNALKEAFPNLLMYSDLDPDDWDVRRGLHDIITKN